MNKRRLDIHDIELVSIIELKPHPRNYQGHPEDELEHIKDSIINNGVYKNIVIARDGTILAGHGVVEAARLLGLETIPVVRLDIEPDSPQAMKILVGDNRISQLVELDDRLLSEILKDIKINEGDLLGTGFDEMMLANLVYVTRPESEIADFDAAAEWVGMPEYDDNIGSSLKLVVHFRNMTDRGKFLRILGITLSDRARSTWYPPRDNEDTSSLRYTEK